MGKSMRLCGGGSVACFVQTHFLCFCSLNCFFPRCVCVCVLLQLALPKLLFCTVAAASIVSFLGVDVPLHLALFQPLFCAFAACMIFFPRYRSAFAACIVQATFLHFCCSLHCFFPRYGCAFASCMVATALLCFYALRWFLYGCALAGCTQASHWTGI